VQVHEHLTLFSSVLNTVEENLPSSPQSECASCHQHRHVGTKTLLQKNPLVLNWGCSLTQVVLYNGRKPVAVVP